MTKGSLLPGSGSNYCRNGGSAADIDLSEHNQGGSGEFEGSKEEGLVKSLSRKNSRQLKKLCSKKKGSLEKKAVFNLRFGRHVDAEQIAAGWPPWLTAVAGEAVEGWLPLRADLFEKMDKIGQGTYSSVYRALNVQNGKTVALKKVRFDNFQPESVRFMSREISILRRLDHPNIVKLEGLITNRLSCSVYLVFEYMEHDLSGLLSCSDIKFSDSQIKCYMRQLLGGIEHCHSQGIMHRDIKTSNILVNNEGVLKIADLGLANYISEDQRQSLTSRVVTLWYRPPELLLGSTTYGPSVDLWSVGCVFAELFVRKPILKGRTEVEQLHKIFKLCGSPPEEFWKKSKLPLATIFKPQHPYVSILRERCRALPKNAVQLLETLLSIEPHRRGTASDALDSEYFMTSPYACDPSSLPKYPPNKEFDAKIREEVRRRKAGVKAQASGTSNNPRRSTKTAEDRETTITYACKNSGDNAHILRSKIPNASREPINSSYDTSSGASQRTDKYQANSQWSGPLITPSSGFAWVKQRRGNNAVPKRYHSQVLPGSRNMNDSEQENKELISSDALVDSVVDETYEVKRMMRGQKMNTVDASHVYDSPEFSVGYNCKQGKLQLKSGPLLPLPNNEDHDTYYLPKPAQRSRLYRD